MYGMALDTYRHSYWLLAIGHKNYLLFTLPFTVHRSPFTVYRSPFTVHRLPFTVYRSPFTV